MGRVAPYASSTSQNRAWSRAVLVDCLTGRVNTKFYLVLKCEKELLIFKLQSAGCSGLKTAVYTSLGYKFMDYICTNVGMECAHAELFASRTGCSKIP